ncbi:MAG: alkaline phosphatase family protein [Nanoarchaeota archaeon]|nr:alkaline phosphatase family protein [Nanoarchaeota archaeon]
MFKPNYKDGSIVNLMSSILSHYGEDSKYKNLKIFPQNRFENKKNIVLLVIDGLGYDFLKKKGKGTFLAEHVCGQMTSVFPPTTASAITTFMTGVAPGEHAITGWYMFLKEIGIVTRILPFDARYKDIPFKGSGLSINEVLEEKSISEKIRAKCFAVIPSSIKDSEYNAGTGKNAVKLGYSTIEGMFMHIKKAVRSSFRKKLIYSYWPFFDDLSHEFGVNSRKSEQHFHVLDKNIEKFAQKIKGTETLLIITADHGFIDTTRKKILLLEDHPKLAECLSIPFCGEGRSVYCYVHTDKANDFEKYVKTRLSQYCILKTRKEMIQENFYGLSASNKKLHDRIGDYVLLMKEDYCFKDSLVGMDYTFHIGNHGGVSMEEMEVPLILVDC